MLKNHANAQAKARNAQPPRKYVEESFHGYVLRRLQEDPKPDWFFMDREEQTSLLGLVLIAYLDRLQYAEMDVQPVLNSLEALFDAIQGSVNAVHRENYALGSVVRHLNRLNRRQLEMMYENSREGDPELMHLSEEMMNRLAMIHDVLLLSGTDRSEISVRFKELHDALIRMADRLDDLALRHFYAALKRKKTESLAAICLGVDFFRAAAGALEYRLTDMAYYDFSKTCFDPTALMALGEDFDFRLFDDETNPILPDVAELLYGRDDFHDG